MSDDKTRKLLPCPFCGGAEVFTSIYGRNAKKWGILCNGCDAWLEGYDSETAAATAWNRRALPAVKVMPLEWRWNDRINGWRADCELTRDAFVSYESAGKWMAGSQMLETTWHSDADAAKEHLGQMRAARILAAIQTG